MKLRVSHILIALTAATLLFVNGCSSSPKIASNPEDVQQIAKDAYIYGYPLVLMDKSQVVATGVSSPRSVGISAKAPINQLAHFRSFPDDTFTDVVTPNADTLYSMAWLDLSTEPQILILPDSGGRYYLAPMLDAWTNVFFSPGTRTTGDLLQTYAIVGPSWKGATPDGVKVVKAPTNMVWILGRTNTKGRADYKAVAAFQDEMKITPLSKWSTNYVAPPVAVDNSVDTKTAPVQQVAAMSGEEFFGRLAELLKKNPPAAADGDALRNFARIGLIPGKSFDGSRFSDEGRSALNSGAKQGYEVILAEARSPRGEVKNNWTYSRNTGSYGIDYKYRATVAMLGLGANLDADALYPRATKDANGDNLNGKNRYRIHFSKENLPPVNGFWSLTMYNSKQAFVKNPIKRFAIGDRDKLVYNKDGSLNLYVQNQSPGGAKAANWLPAPKRDFNLVMRLYWPKDTALNGTWQVPGIERVSPPPRMSKTASLE